MVGTLKRYFYSFLSLILPGRVRGHMLARLGVLKACGKGGLFCTTKIGTEPYLISIGDETVIASDVMFINHDMAVTVVSRYLKQGECIGLGEIRVGSYCFIGAGAMILPGVTIGDGIVIGAGSLVKADITEPGVYVGIGPRKVSELEPYLEHAVNDGEARHRALVEAYPDKFRMDGKRICKR